MKIYSPKSLLSCLTEHIIYSIVSAMWYCAHCGLKKIVLSLDKMFYYSWSCLWFLESELALMWYMGCVFAGDQMWLNLKLHACSSVWFFLDGLLFLLSVVSNFWILLETPCNLQYWWQVWTSLGILLPASHAFVCVGWFSPLLVSIWWKFSCLEKNRSI